MDGSHPSGAAGREISRRDWGRWSSHTAEEQPGRVPSWIINWRSSATRKAGGFISTCCWKGRAGLCFFVCLFALLIHSLADNPAQCSATQQSRPCSPCGRQSGVFHPVSRAEQTFRAAGKAVSSNQLSPRVTQGNQRGIQVGTAATGEGWNNTRPD